MKELYDHTQLAKGDIAVYGSITGFAGNWRITRTRVLRKTMTQIVMENGMRFMRATGLQYGGRNGCRLLDPEGEAVRSALGEEVMMELRYKLSNWERDCRSTRTLDQWEILLSQLETIAAVAQREIRKIKADAK